MHLIFFEKILVLGLQSSIAKESEAFQLIFERLNRWHVLDENTFTLTKKVSKIYLIVKTNGLN